MLVVWALTLRQLSGAFAYERAVLDKPVLAFVILQMLAGLVYLVTLTIIKGKPTQPALMLGIVLAGLLMRLVQLGGTPILEDDFYRYLWDGAMTAHGQNPYALSPQQILDTESDVTTPVMGLAYDADPTLRRINHPWLRTIYPPMAQMAFALAYWINPWQIDGLRVVWLAIDILILLLLIRLIGHSPHAMFSLAIYWLNPLLIKEVYNAGHMELVLVVCVIATLIAVQARHFKQSGLFLGLATGAKLWPAIWLPVLLRQVLTSWRIRLIVIACLIIPVLLFALPIIQGRLDSTSGFVAYAQRWQMNDSAYNLIHAMTDRLSPNHAHLLARLLIAGLLAAIMMYCIRRLSPDFGGFCNSTLAITLALFLLSPTQFPWYYLWVLPLLVLKPLWSVLALTLMLPLYYLRFPLDAMGYAKWFDNGVVWIEFVPIWLLLAWELWYLKRHDPIMSVRQAGRRIIVFSRLPQPGVTKTRLIPALGPQGAAQLQQWLTQRTLATVDQVKQRSHCEIQVCFTGGTNQQMSEVFGHGYDYVAQGEGELGDRLHHSFANAFSQGLQHVLCIGSDCPTLTPEHIHMAYDHLGSNDLVLGPAVDGGYYLIGMNRLIPELFEQIDWGTDKVLAQTLEHARSLGLRVHLLELLPDVDQPDDLAQWNMHPTDHLQTLRPWLSVIIPTLNESSRITRTIALADQCPNVQIIVVDAGSTDQTVALAQAARAQVHTCAAGRGRQLHYGAQVATGDVLLFLHADTHLPPGYWQEIKHILNTPDTLAGAFRLAFDHTTQVMRLIQWGANLRSTWRQLPYGDQALFLTREHYHQMGGFKPLLVMEDFDFVMRLRRAGRIRISSHCVTTSARKYLDKGPWLTVLLHQWMIMTWQYRRETE